MHRLSSYCHILNPRLVELETQLKEQSNFFQKKGGRGRRHSIIILYLLNSGSDVIPRHYFVVCFIPCFFFFFFSFTPTISCVPPNYYALKASTSHLLLNSKLKEITQKRPLGDKGLLRFPVIQSNLCLSKMSV